ncbi:tRNA glutamyl-Q(34) synthetase GluQRS [Pseudomaricurvus sp. HS19]|nr:tRNA glutamyl-Q(34) synthetase GluQRS [Pseudomaricurvus sp. HS19]
MTPGADYIGRFAPSPTGELHQGSLLTAVASWLDARQHHGQWLVRMEDLDPPREQPGAAEAILRALEAHGLEWDGEVMYQSEHHDAYQACLDELARRELIYPCNCNRQRLQSLTAYDGHCLQHPPASGPVALRVKTPASGEDELCFDDLLQGRQCQQLRSEVGDFVLRRKDGLYAYQLAVVVDDIAQGITHVLRGCDLLDSTPRQLWLFRLLQAPAPQFGHLPVVVNPEGQKLSKQTFAAPLQAVQASHNLWLALHRLQLQPPPELRGADCQTLLAWGLNHWHRGAVAALRSLPESSVP